MAETHSELKALEHDLEDLARLDANGLARRWRTLVGGVAPAGVGRALMLRVLSYYLQARRYGDLDRASQQALNALAKRFAGHTKDEGPRRKGDAAGTLMLRSGTILTREHGGCLHRVTVTEDGFSWNGKSYDSLSRVALAMTGTRWNGPRFFGLRDRRGASMGETDRTEMRSGASRTRSPQALEAPRP